MMPPASTTIPRTSRDSAAGRLARFLLCILLLGALGADPASAAAGSGAGESLVGGLCGDGPDSAAAHAVLPALAGAAAGNDRADAVIPPRPDAALGGASAFEAAWRKTGPPLLRS